MEYRDTTDGEPGTPLLTEISEENKTATYPSDDHIALLTLNMFMRPPPVKTNESDHKDDRLALFVKTELAKYDICCFQEFFTMCNTRK